MFAKCRLERLMQGQGPAQLSVVSCKGKDSGTTGRIGIFADTFQGLNGFDEELLPSGFQDIDIRDRVRKWAALMQQQLQKLRIADAKVVGASIPNGSNAKAARSTDKTKNADPRLHKSWGAMNDENRLAAREKTNRGVVRRNDSRDGIGTRYIVIPLHFASTQHMPVTYLPVESMEVYVWTLGARKVREVYASSSDAAQEIKRALGRTGSDNAQRMDAAIKSWMVEQGFVQLADCRLLQLTGGCATLGAILASRRRWWSTQRFHSFGRRWASASWSRCTAGSCMERGPFMSYFIAFKRKHRSVSASRLLTALVYNASGGALACPCRDLMKVLWTQDRNCGGPDHCEQCRVIPHSQLMARALAPWRANVGLQASLLDSSWMRRIVTRTVGGRMAGSRTD